MMTIAVSLGNRIYDESYSYAKKKTVRHVSELSARNFLVKVQIGGVEEQEAWDVKHTLPDTPPLLKSMIMK